MKMFHSFHTYQVEEEPLTESLISINSNSLQSIRFCEEFDKRKKNHFYHIKIETTDFRFSETHQTEDGARLRIEFILTEFEVPEDEAQEFARRIKFINKEK